MIESKETYLGDSLFASFDGFRIWLRVGDGSYPRIALDQKVFNALVKYADALKARIGSDPVIKELLHNIAASKAITTEALEND